jgi:hypothetical protein
VDFDFDVETDTTEALAEEMAEALNLDSNEQREVRTHHESSSPSVIGPPIEALRANEATELTHLRILAGASSAHNLESNEQVEVF